MVSCRAFWVAISYRLAACFTEVRVELKFIGDRSRILGTIITLSRKLRAKMTKMRQKLLIIARKLRCFVFVHFMYLFSYNF